MCRFFYAWFTSCGISLRFIINRERIYCCCALKVSGSVHCGVLTLHLVISVGYLRGSLTGYQFLKQLPVFTVVGKL